MRSSKCQHQQRKSLRFEPKSVVAVVLSLIFSVISGGLSHDIILGGTVLFTGILTGYFASVGKRCNYIVSLINYLLMGYVAFSAHLYGTAGFYVLVCSPLQIHGFINWGRNLDSGIVKSRKFSIKTSIAVILSCILGSILVGYLLGLIPGERLNVLDAMTNCINLCGIILMNLRYAEAWWIWLANNVIDCIIWGIVLISGDNANALMMFITSVTFLLINIYGIFRWMKVSKVENAT